MAMVILMVSLVMIWSVAEAKAKLSEVLERAREEPQVIESRGRPKAVVVSSDDFARLKKFEEGSKGPGLAGFLARCDALRAEGPMDLEIPPRSLEPERSQPFESE